MQFVPEIFVWTRFARGVDALNCTFCFRDGRLHRGFVNLFKSAAIQWTSKRPAKYKKTGAGAPLWYDTALTTACWWLDRCVWWLCAITSFDTMAFLVMVGDDLCDRVLVTVYWGLWWLVYWCVLMITRNDCDTEPSIHSHHTAINQHDQRTITLCNYQQTSRQQSLLQQTILGFVKRKRQAALFQIQKFLRRDRQCTVDLTCLTKVYTNSELKGGLTKVLLKKW